jgi:hypothetical protein
MFVAVAITIAAAVWAQDPLATAPGVYSKLFENSSVAVIRAYYRPHEKLPVHDHSPYPTVYVYLSDSGPVRFTHVEKDAFTLTRQPLRMGTFRVSPGRLEKHEVENLGETASEFLRVELKTIPLRTLHQFRSKPAFDMNQPGVTTEYSSAAVDVIRVVAHEARVLPVRHPTLLVAFTPATIERPGAAEVRLKRGEVLWVEGRQALRIRGAAVPAHVLGIVIGGSVLK